MDSTTGRLGNMVARLEGTTLNDMLEKNYTDMIFKENPKAKAVGVQIKDVFWWE